MLRSSRTSLFTCVTGALALLIMACVSQSVTVDPARVEQQIAASKVRELELVRSTIGDPERIERFIDLLAERERLVEGYVEQVIAHKETMTRLNADYGTSRSEFEAVIANYNQARAAAQLEMVDLIDEMKRVTTAEEWTRISAFQVDRLNLREMAYRDRQGGG